MTEDLSWLPDDLDLRRPNAARVYDYYLGGAHNLEADRQFARNIMQEAPEVVSVARYNRGFLRRSARLLAESGIRQFLDLGSGIPTAGNVHEVVHRVDPSCRSGAPRLLMTCRKTRSWPPSMPPSVALTPATVGR